MQEDKPGQALITEQNPKHFKKRAVKLKEFENKHQSGFFGSKQQKPTLTYLSRRIFGEKTELERSKGITDNLTREGPQGARLVGTDEGFLQDSVPAKNVLGPQSVT